MFVSTHTGLCEKLDQYKQLPRANHTSELGGEAAAGAVTQPLSVFRHLRGHLHASCAAALPTNGGTTGDVASVVNYICNTSALKWGECRRSVFLVTDGSESGLRLPPEDPPGLL